MECILLISLITCVLGIFYFYNNEVKSSDDSPSIPLGTIRFHCLTRKEGHSIYGELGGRWAIQIKEKYSYCYADVAGMAIGWRDIDEKFFSTGKTYASLEEAKMAYEKRTSYKQPSDVFVEKIL